MNSFTEPSFTFKDLKVILSALSEPDLEKDVTVYFEEVNEYYQAHAFSFTDSESDVLDPYHPFIKINKPEKI